MPITPVDSKRLSQSTDYGQLRSCMSLINYRWTPWVVDLGNVRMKHVTKLAQ